MKKITVPRKKAKKPQAPSRITNETVAEHRERILAGGRRFKYPVQYARHRLVINAIVISLVVLVLLVAIVWQQLYIGQNTSNFFYRVTRFIPVPVASVDGQMVRYSDYLLYLNGSAYHLQRNDQIDFSTENGKAQLDHIKRQSINGAEADAYAMKLAKELGVTVEEKEIDEIIEQDRASYGNISEEVYNASALSVLGWSTSEYRHVIYNKLLRFKVEYMIDKGANKVQAKVADALKKDPDADFDKLSKNINSQHSGSTIVGRSGLVPYNNSDGGLSDAAAKLKKDQVSDVIKSNSGDGYYFIRLLEDTGSQLSYSYIYIPLSEFDDRLAKLRDAKKIEEYITVPEGASLAPQTSDQNN